MKVFGFSKEYEVEREKPLESLATGLKFDFDIRTTVIRDPDTEIITISMIPNLMTTL